MRKTLFFIFAFIQFVCFSQTKIIPNLIDKNGEYEFYITYYNSIIIDEKAKEPTEFILNDKQILSEIINNWKGKKVNYSLKCGFDYSIFITRDNKIIEEIRYNSECNYAESSNGNFEVKNNPFKELKINNDFKSFTLKTENIEEARQFLNNSINIKNVFVPYIENYNWRSYEYKFYIKVEKTKKAKSLKDFEFYETEIHNKFPNEKFEIELFINSRDICSLIIYCHSDFWDKFDLYKKDKQEQIEESFTVTIFGDSLEIEKIKQKYQ